MGVQLHDVFTVGIPVFVILVGILFNRSDVRRLEDDMDKRFNKLEARLDRLGSKVDAGLDRLEARMDARFDIVHKDLNEFFRSLGHVEGRIDTIEKRG